MQKKFILLTMSALLLVLTVIIGGINIVNYKAIIDEADEVLSVLAENRGVFPIDDIEARGAADEKPGNDMPRADKFPHEMSPETPFESRYFSVLLDDSGEIVHVETSRIFAVNSDQAVTYAQQAVKDSDGRGFTDQFRYAVSHDAKGTQAVFLDCGRRLDAFHMFLRVSILMAITGFLIVLLLVSYFSGRIIRPVSESYEKQKQFITDAGHELKTPLTIINADVDVLKMDIGDNEWLEDIKGQVLNLASLTDDLVYLSRMEEGAAAIPMMEFAVSDVVEESASAFEGPALAQNKKLTIDIQPMLSMKGNEKSIRQLVGILMDNAVKYSVPDGIISLKLGRTGKDLILTVSNTTDTQFTRSDLERIFDRFYRMDQSRNSETGGHGIGLSIAKAIVENHKGRIHASMNGDQLEIRAEFAI